MVRTLFIGMAIVAYASFATADAQTADAFLANPAFKGPRPGRCLSTLEMQRCAASDLRAADAEMRARYLDLRERLRPVERQTLSTEQRAWTRMRDRSCDARSGSGSMASLNVAQCWIRATRERTAALGAGTERKSAPASAFIGRWRSGEGPYMHITRKGDRLRIKNQWTLDDKDTGSFLGTVTPSGLRFRRNGVMETARPSRGDAIHLSALRGKADCLKVSDDEGYCRY